LNNKRSAFGEESTDTNDEVHGDAMGDSAQRGDQATMQKIG
jgi:hypothetical protein